MPDIVLTASQGTKEVTNRLEFLLQGLITRRSFPLKSTGPLDLQKVLVSLRRRGRPRRAQHRILAGRDNHPGSWGMLLYSGADRIFVIHAIADKAIDCTLDLRQRSGTWDGSCSWLSVTVEVTIWPWASTPMCNFFQRLGFFSPCFWACHSPWPQTFKPPEPILDEMLSGLGSRPVHRILQSISRFKPNHTTGWDSCFLTRFEIAAHTGAFLTYLKRPKAP
jgi:hypothetical protein